MTQKRGDKNVSVLWARFASPAQQQSVWSHSSTRENSREALTSGPPLWVVCLGVVWAVVASVVSLPVGTAVGVAAVVVGIIGVIVVVAAVVAASIVGAAVVVASVPIGVFGVLVGIVIVASVVSVVMIVDPSGAFDSVVTIVTTVVLDTALSLSLVASCGVAVMVVWPWTERIREISDTQARGVMHALVKFWFWQPPFFFLKIKSVFN